MGNYREQYENYYGNIKRRGAATYTGISARDKKDLSPVNRGDSVLKRVVRKLIFQLTGAFILLAIVFLLRYIPIEDSSNKLYSQAKDMIKKDVDFNEVIMYLDVPDGERYKEKVLDYIDEVKASVSGERTLKELIKEDYIEPIKGKIKYLSSESTGIAISSENAENVQSVYGGTVEEVRNDDEKSVVINHGNGTETYYGALSEVNVEEGSTIAKGEVIGKCGNIDTTDIKGVIFKFIYLGNEKDPSDVMDFSSLEEV